jgi:drug/metabolite transporter (DMT)-like permease
MTDFAAPIKLAFGKLPGNVRGSLYALLATAMFTGVAAMVKYASSDYHVAEILFFRQSVMLLVVMPTLVRHFPQSLKTRRPALHLLRLAGALTALSLSFTALGHLPLATAISFSFTKTLFVTLFAALLLGEMVGWRRGLAVLAGFIGMLIMLRPDPGSAISIYAIFAIIAAIGAATAVTCVRALTSTESTATLLSYQAIFVGILVALPTWFVWKTPDLAGLLLLILIGAVSYIAQWLGVQGYRAGEVSVVTGMEYTKLLYATLFGILIFSEWPDVQTLFGATIIIAASIFTIWRENVASKTKKGR